MLFNSISFLIYFPIVTLGYFLLKGKLRIFWLLGASCAFYMAFIPSYILILLLAIVIDYGAARLMEGKSQRTRYWLLVTSIVSTCLILFFFKYFNFFIVNWNALADFFHLQGRMDILKIALPIGLSFHTFQSLSYVIEVYRNKVPIEKDFWVYSLFVVFYPQLVAGPIERPWQLLTQFHEEKKFNTSDFRYGLWLMIWGMFKKVVIADRLSPYVDDVFSDPQAATGWESLLGVYFFTIQIYCDFSGYSDIAIGAARTMGFKLQKNFEVPYISLSITEFWRRWHISLSSWFRDYVYIPFGGNKRGLSRQVLGLLLTFSVSGLWHGANWTFVAWGSLHAVYVIAELFLKKAGFLKENPTGINRWVRWFVTFHLAAFAWIFFRAASFSDLLIILQNIGSGIHPRIPFGADFETVVDLIVLIPMTGILIWLDKKAWPNPIEHYTQHAHPRWQIAATLTGVLLILGFGAFTNAQSFIYFQF